MSIRKELTAETERIKNSGKNSIQDSADIPSFPSEDLINRRVSFKFSGKEIKMDLSLGLFSSAAVDTGSMLLLKAVGRNLKQKNILSVLDAGCGTGTLSLAIAAGYPEAEVLAVDRDRLAVEFTKHNAALNKLENIKAENRLMLEGPHRSLYDLIISNFPAKAGETALKDFIFNSLNLLSHNGTAAMVIVHTLEELCANILDSAGCEYTVQEKSKQHTVFIYNKKNTSAPAGSINEVPSGSLPYSAESLKSEEILKPYIRDNYNFKNKRVSYTLKTVRSIPDFDNLSWQIKLAGNLLDKHEPLKGNMFFYSPGQGHLPAAVCGRRASEPDKVILAGRDRLALLTGKINMTAILPETEIETVSIPDITVIKNSMNEYEKFFNVYGIILNPVAGSKWSTPFINSVKYLLNENGILIISGRSSDISRFDKERKGMQVIGDKRYHGWRSLLLKVTTR